MKCFLMGGLLLFSVVACADDSPITTDAELRPFEPEATMDVLPSETRQLVEKLSEALSSSAEVFEPLTAEQMSFRPADGSHTPRWNAEHLAGAHLKFLSSYLHSLDDRIAVVDRLPKQMPDDYQPRHADWDGAKEAEQMRAVDAFTRRYAYLMKDVDLDSNMPEGVVPPFFKTPRSLLTILTGHYGQHTGNVKTKFEADDWPGSKQ